MLEYCRSDLWRYNCRGGLPPFLILSLILSGLVYLGPVLSPTATTFLVEGHRFRYDYVLPCC